MSRLSLPLFFVCVALAPCAAWAQHTSLSQDDMKYMKKNAEGLRSEVLLGKMAQTRAHDPRVKHFGQRMIDDHGMDLHRLQRIAQRKGMALPTRPDAEQRREAAKLAKLSGSAFDREYISYEVKDHQHDVADESKALKHTKDKDLKRFAGVSLPEVRSHLRLARQINRQL